MGAAVAWLRKKNIAVFCFSRNRDTQRWSRARPVALVAQAREQESVHICMDGCLQLRIFISQIIFNIFEHIFNIFFYSKLRHHNIKNDFRKKCEEYNFYKFIRLKRILVFVDTYFLLEKNL
jgi:hypothetical protein